MEEKQQPTKALTENELNGNDGTMLPDREALSVVTATGEDALTASDPGGIIGSGPADSGDAEAIGPYPADSGDAEAIGPYPADSGDAEAIGPYPADGDDAEPIGPEPVS